MRVGLHITTYRSEANLEVVLRTVVDQQVRADEVLVLDDGSPDATACLVDSMKPHIVGLRHVWQEDSGFRLARLRNLGILCSTADYIISIDGDMLLHSRFVEDHINAARVGHFMQGSRQRLNAQLSKQLLESQRCPQGLECLLGRDPKNKSRLQGFRLPLVSRLFSKDYSLPRKIMGCNQSFFRDDLFRVNGYDSSFTGWGEEDYELASRMCLLGLNETHLSYSGIAWHLYHDEKERMNQRGHAPISTVSTNGLRELKEAIIDGTAGTVLLDGDPFNPAFV